MVTEERVVNLEATLARFIEHSELIVAAIHEDIAEIRAINARTDRQLLLIQQQADKERQAAEKARQAWEEFYAKDRQAWEERYQKRPSGFQ